MIEIEEIPVERIGEFWDAHIRYLVEDGFIADEEDIDYFSGAEYRGIIQSHMLRDVDRHHMVYFVRGGERIGAVYYEINSEKEDSVRFWKSLGFVENGADEYGMPLFIKR